MKNIVDFQGLQIRLASPDTIKSWSHGEVIKPETINYRTLKPEKDGLFCERIFGPTKDWECYCGKYKRIRYRGIICDKCGVEVTLSRVRRERMGHIQLACPVVHVWFFKGAPSKLSLLLDISPRNLSSIIYFSQYVVLNVDLDQRLKVIEQLDLDLEAKKQELTKEAKISLEKEKAELKSHLAAIKTELKNKEQQDLKTEEARIKSKQRLKHLKDNLDHQIQNAEDIYKTIKDMVKRLEVRSVISEDEYLKLVDYHAADHITVGMGAEALVQLVKQIDIESLASELREESKKGQGAKRIKASKRLRVVEGMKTAHIDPAWMILSVLPVIPPDLRPMVQLSGGRFASSDLNDLYRRVINRNNRLKHLIDLGAPEIILRNEKRMLQEAVDALIDSSQQKETAARRNRKQLRSLSEMLRGKQGRFRQNLLGKRVDYSGRSVIVVGPELQLTQCGLPKDMALEMFRPYVLRELIKSGIAPNVKSAKNALVRRVPEVYDILEEIIAHHPVLLNRAPTLHKLGIQAFYPVLVEGNAIRIHPCVCAGYNADFDGDQMAVHVPLSNAAQSEAASLMMPDSNLLKPADGSPITVPNKEMVMGCYYLTMFSPHLEPHPTIFSSPEEAEFAYQSRLIALTQPISVRLLLPGGKTQILVTSVGRIRFNQVLPEELRYLNEPINAGSVKQLIRKAIKLYDRERIVKLIDQLKDLGFQAATQSGLSVSVADNVMINTKPALIEAANKRAETVQDNFKMGLITAEEKRRLTQEIWMETTDEIADQTWNIFTPDNAVKIIIDSGGTRASKDQVKQLAAMRGLVVDPLGKIVELPTKSNFREGLSVFEYVTSSRGSRKGLTDSALKTADAGYLTRRLVDVAHDAIIRELDCGTKDHLIISVQGKRGPTFSRRLTGRLVAQKVIDPKTKKVLAAVGDLLDEELVEVLEAKKVSQVAVFSPLTCQARYGLCAKCYGRDFSTKELVSLGTPVGVIAAQSIGEPGTQLTMRVKHAGGIVGLDVTQGLPRVEELFETRIPKNVAPLSDFAGKLIVNEKPDGYVITLNSTKKPIKTKTYTIPLTSLLKVTDGDLVGAGTQLSAGSLDIKDILEIKGLLAAQEYLLAEIQAVYESQGIPINDRHFEVIIRRMSDKVVVEQSGDTTLLPGEIVERAFFNQANERVIAEGGEPATAQVIILGISTASLHTHSWLSASSFQETTNVLTDASIQGKEDYLLGLKENVIIGRLIPTSSERAVISHLYS
ncbi:DNA-directed RNA polymerase subunit beta' [Microgenomates group bacterium RBG_16_45_19]|nr:MAG: DNA-directed RNA polymerase subunit beta' [Microgenomates group bacterium RBG_16_45_19]